MIFPRFYRRGFIVVTATSLLCVLCFTLVIQFVTAVSEEYESVYIQSQQIRGKELGRGILGLIQNFITEKEITLLYEYGLLPESPVIPFYLGSDKKEVAYIRYVITEETGKINVNSLIRFYAPGINLVTHGVLKRLSDNIGLDRNIWEAVIDYIDSNDENLLYGFEQEDYDSLVPKRRIKNAPLHSLGELLFIPGFSRRMLYGELITKDDKQDFLDKYFFRDDDVLLLDPEKDLILGNLLTTIMPYSSFDNEEGLSTVNINSASFHTLWALSEDMTINIVKDILKARLNSPNGRFQQISDVQNIPSLQAKGIQVPTIFEGIEKRITLEDRIYKILVEVILNNQQASVSSIFDLANKTSIQYFE